MLPLTLSPQVRHRRPLTAGQQARRALLLLIVLAGVAAIGVYGNGAGTDDLILTHLNTSSPPTVLAITGWATVALPFAAFFVLASPTRSRLLRLAAILILLASLLAIDPDNQVAFTNLAPYRDAVATSGAIVLTGVLVTAMAMVVRLALAHPTAHPALVTGLRRTVTWLGPLLLAAALTVALVTR